VSDFWPFVIAGLTTGSLYGLAAMGLVLTYKTSGIFNFAHGAIAAGAAYIFFELNTRNDISWPIAALIVMVATEADRVASAAFLLSWGFLNFFWLALVRRPIVAAPSL